MENSQDHDHAILNNNYGVNPQNHDGFGDNPQNYDGFGDTVKAFSIGTIVFSILIIVLFFYALYVIIKHWTLLQNQSSKGVLYLLLALFLPVLGPVIAVVGVRNAVKEAKVNTPLRTTTRKKR
jgi:hypothetical protein